MERGRQRRIGFKLIAGGSRAETIKGFLWACKSRKPGLNVLLVDSEGPVTDTAKAIQCLRSRSYWDRDVAFDNDQVNLMVQAMEAWFVADPRALVKHFGKDFNNNALPKPQSVESKSPRDLTAAIGKGLRNCDRRTYHKADDGMKLLELINHNEVGRNCQHFQRPMDCLDRTI